MNRLSGRMTSHKFYFSSVELLDFLSGECGSVKHPAYLAYSLTICSSFILYILSFSRQRYLEWEPNKSIVYYHRVVSAMLTIVFTLVSALGYSLKSMNKNILTTELELLKSSTEVQLISRYPSRFIRLWMLKAFVFQYVHAGLWMVYQLFRICSLIKTASGLFSVLNSVDYQITVLYIALINISICYSFVMIHSCCFELFLEMIKDFEETSNPMYVTLRFDKNHREQTRGSSVSTISNRAHDIQGHFKDGKLDHLKLLYKNYCLLDNINLLNNKYHSFAVSCLLLIQTIYIPEIPGLSKGSAKDYYVNDFVVSTISFFAIVQSVVSLTTVGDCYNYKRCASRINFKNKIYLNEKGLTRKLITNMILKLADTTSGLSWKCFPLDISVLPTMMDLAVLLLTTFFTEEAQTQ